MTQLVHNILRKNYSEAEQALAENFVTIMEKKLHERKKMVSAKMAVEMDLSREKPAHDSIDDRRGNVWTKIFNPNPPTSSQQKTNTAGKGDLQKPQTTNTAAKGDLQKEEEQLEEQRIKIVTRIRGGKIQRRKKLSNVAGMTLRGGKLTRMSPAERRRRKMGAKRGKVKRKAKMARTLMKRKRSLVRRKAMGL